MGEGREGPGLGDAELLGTPTALLCIQERAQGQLLLPWWWLPGTRGVYRPPGSS